MCNEQHIWNWLKQCSGLNEYAIAAIMGNMEAESAGRPNNVEDTCPYSDVVYTQSVDDGTYRYFETDKYGYGLCQWTFPSRKKALLEFAKQKNTSISDIDMQLEFLIRELMNSFKTVWNSLVTAGNIMSPCDRFLREFENPLNPNLKERHELSAAIYDRNHEENAANSDVQSSSSTSSIGQSISYSTNIQTMCTASLPVLKRGSNGIAVRVLQAALVQRGCTPSSNDDFGIDGDFGKDTESAVKIFQTSAKIASDGIVGPLTYAALFK